MSEDGARSARRRLSEAFTYSVTGQPATTTYNGVAASTDAYNGLHQLTDQKVTNPSKALLVDYTYGYNAAGQMTSAGRTCTTSCASSTTYTYDGAGRLASSTSGSASTKYAYDLDGNLTSAGSFSATYNAQDQMTASTSGASSSTYSYTPRGTMASVVTGSATVSSSFDAFDQQASDGARSYSYDGLGRLASASGDGASETFGYDAMGNQPVTDGTNTYGWTGDGQLAGVSTGSTAYDEVQNQHGDVVASLSKTGVAGLTNYSPGGAGATTGYSPAIGYQGGWTDPASGEVSAGSRWYSPAIQRFVSADTAQNAPDPAVAANSYAYGNDDPLDLSDLSGHDACGDYEEEKIEQAQERAEEQKVREEEVRQELEERAEDAESAAEDAEQQIEDEAEERASTREEREVREQEAEQEYADERGEIGESRAEMHTEYEQEQRWERFERQHPREAQEIMAEEEAESEGSEGLLGELFEGGAEFIAEDPEVLFLLVAGPGPSLADCGSAGEPDEVRANPRDAARQAQQRVQDAVDHPDAAPEEDPAAKAAQESKSYDPSAAGDDASADTTADTASDSGGGGDEPPADEPPGGPPRTRECGEDPSEPGKTLFRFGLGPETTEGLLAQAQTAVANGFPYGVSMSSKLPPKFQASGEYRVTSQGALDRVGIGSDQTGRNPYHYTARLPEPVTPEMTDALNSALDDC